MAQSPLRRPIVRYLIAGGANTTFGFLLFRGLLHLLKDRPSAVWIAQSTAYMACVIVGYTVHHAWTFRSDGPHGRQVPRFAAAHLGNAVLSSALMQVGVAVLHLPLVAWWVLVAGVTTAVNFVLQRSWVFGHDATARDRDA